MVKSIASHFSGYKTALTYEKAEKSRNKNLENNRMANNWKKQNQKITDCQEFLYKQKALEHILRCPR